MSQRFPKSYFTDTQLTKIKSQCFVVGEENEYGPPDTVKAYIETMENIYVPFHIGYKILSKKGKKPNEYKKYPPTNYEMKYSFRNEMQKAVFEESMDYLHNQGSSVLSMYCGAGKCLGKDTTVLMYDKSIKKVQDIQKGDLLMGDDNTPRKVLSICQGEEDLYRVSQGLSNNSFVINYSHILTFLYPKNNVIQQDNKMYKLEWYDIHSGFFHCMYHNNIDVLKEEQKKNSDKKVIDIPLKVYLTFSETNKKKLYGYRPLCDTYDKQNTIENFKETIEILINTIMYYIDNENTLKSLLQQDIFSIQYLENSSIFSRLYVIKQLLLNIKIGNQYILSSYYPCLEWIIRVCHSIGFEAEVKENKLHIYPTYELDETLPVCDNVYNSICIEKISRGKYYGFTLDKNHRFRLSDYLVSHNTFSAINIAHKLKVKTGILVHRKVLTKQWIDSITKFTSGNYQVVSSQTKIDKNKDFYIFSMGYVHKQWNKETKTWNAKPLGIYKHIGFLVIDEAHIACASEMVKSLFYFEPLYTLALTATPYRKDGLDKILDLYFGKDKIIRQAKSKFYVYIFQTFFKPENCRNIMGKKDWSKVIASISDNENRNNKIVKIVEFFQENNYILILTKLRRHVMTLYTMIQKQGLSVTKMCGNDQEYDTTASILISTYSKLGVGFDDTRFNCLILASDVEQVEQYAGRLREGERDRYIIDMVDDDYNCKNHLKTRKKWYASRNGIVSPFEKKFPEFFFSKKDTPKYGDGNGNSSNGNSSNGNTSNGNTRNGNSQDKIDKYVRLAK